MHDAATINPARLAAHEKKSQPPEWLTESQSAELLGVGRRSFHTMRQQPWFIAHCEARALGPRTLRFSRAELIAAAKNAPKVVKQAEPVMLAAARNRKAV